MTTHQIAKVNKHPVKLEWTLLVMAVGAAVMIAGLIIFVFCFRQLSQDTHLRVLELVTWNKTWEPAIVNATENVKKHESTIKSIQDYQAEIMRIQRQIIEHVQKQETHMKTMEDRQTEMIRKQTELLLSIQGNKLGAPTDRQWKPHVLVAW